MLSRTRSSVAGVAALILLALGGLSCTQYDYTSPLPGILEVRFAVKNTRPELLPFGTLDTLTGTQNFFIQTLAQLRALQPNDLKLDMYASLVAIRRNPDGDAFNCLDIAARDSNLVLGIAYAPPATYDRIQLLITPQPAVVISYGFYQTFQPVIREGIPQDLVELPLAGQPRVSIPVQEGRTTRVVVTYDMDEGLEQRSEWYRYHQTFSITSITML